MAIKPILFNTDMVKAILDGRKTQTRRVVKFSANDVYDMACAHGKWHESYDPKNPPEALVEWFVQEIAITRWLPGDILWVRETWCSGRLEYGEEPDGRNVPYISQCIGDDGFIHKEWAIRNDVGLDDVIWKPSIHMPKEAARIFLRVKNVRQERLNQMQVFVGDIFDEGVDNVEEFKTIWDSTLNPVEREKYGWDANPWVWVIEFERCDRPEGWDDYVR